MDNSLFRAEFLDTNQIDWDQLNKRLTSCMRTDRLIKNKPSKLIELLCIIRWNILWNDIPDETRKLIAMGTKCVKVKGYKVDYTRASPKNWIRSELIN